MSYNAFLSFSTNPDYKLSQKVESFLETFHELKTTGDISLNKLEICRDGSDFSLQEFSRTSNTNKQPLIFSLLEKYLEQSDYLIVLCSNKTPLSEFIKFEINWFLENRGSDKILLAVTEEAQPLQNQKKIFPEIVIKNRLHKKPFYDLRGYKKAQAKNWEKVRDFEEELTNLAAHLNGYTSGQVMPIWQREKLRKNKVRQKVISGFALLFMLIALIIGWQFLQLKERNNIIKSQKNEAELTTKTVLSNEIVNKLDTIFDKTTKFRLLEHSLKLNPNNSSAFKMLFDLYYYDKSNFYSSKFHHHRSIKSAIFSHGGDILATSAYDDEVIKLWDIQKGQQIKEYNVRNVAVPILAFSPIENKLAIGDSNPFGSKDEFIRILDIQKGTIDTLIAHKAGVRYINYSHDGAMLSAALGNGEVKIWDLKSKTEIFSPIFHHYLITNELRPTLEYNIDKTPIFPHEKRYKSVNPDDILKMTANRVKFSHNGKMLLTVTEGNLTNQYFIHIWDITSKKPKLIDTKSYNTYISAAHFTQNDSSLLISTLDGIVELWEIENRESIFSFKAHNESCIGVMYSIEEDLIFSVSINNQVKVWDTDSLSTISTLHLDDRISALRYSDSTGILSVAVDNRVQLWDLNKYPFQPVIGIDDDSTKLESFCLSADDKILAGLASNDSVLFWNVQNELDSFIYYNVDDRIKEPEGGVEVSTLVGGGWRRLTSIFKAPKEMRYLRKDRIRFGTNYLVNHPVSNEFISIQNKDSLKVWKEGKRSNTIYLGLDSNPTSFPSFSKDGKKLAFPCRDSTVVIFDISTQKKKKINLNSIPNHVSFSPKEAIIAIATSSNILEIWNYENLELKTELSGHKGRINYSMFSKEGNKIITASKDNKCKVWNLEKKKEIFSLEHLDVITTAKFSFSNQYIYTTSFDKTVKIWNAITGQLISNIRHKNTVWNSFLNKEENLIFNLVGDKVIIFHLDKDSIFKEAQKHFDIAQLKPELIDKYDLEKSFEYTGYSIDNLIKENDEEKMSIIADYYFIKLKKAKPSNERKKYFELAFSLYTILEKRAEIIFAKDYKKKLELLKLEFNKEHKLH